HDEREGTFCSEDCIRNFREVSDWVGTGGEAPAAAPPAPSTGSVFEEMPERPAATVEAPPEPEPQPEPEAPPPPAEEAAPAAESAPRSPTRTIGNPCYQHADIRAKAFCTRCRRPICGLCIVENVAGMFCSDECAKNQRGRRGSPAAIKVAVVLLLLAGTAGAVFAFKPGLFESVLGTAPPEGSPVVETPRVPTPPVNPTPTKEAVKTVPPKPDPAVPKPELPKPEPPTEVLNTPPDAPTEPGPIEVVKVTRTTAPPPKPEAPKPTRFITVWGQESPGDWYRVKTREGNKAVFVDFGLKSRDAEASVLLTQKHVDGRSGPVTEKREEHQMVVLHGEETLRMEDRAYLCEIRASQDGSVRQWILMQGRHAGAVLRSEGPEGRFVADRLWENPVRVGLKVYDCLVVEGSIGDGNRRMKTWYSPAFPLGAVRLEIDGEIVAQAVDAGGSWTDRPAAPK
ncbi:MAG TPA: hypothetical protein VEJ18_08005, partial [Planctomycetota bacterium]|nr:hypothetical protein [Planctomycetota bacterium]